MNKYYNFDQLTSDKTFDLLENWPSDGGSETENDPEEEFDDTVTQTIEYNEKHYTAWGRYKTWFYRPLRIPYWLSRGYFFFGLCGVKGNFYQNYSNDESTRMCAMVCMCL